MAEALAHMPEGACCVLECNMCNFTLSFSGEQSAAALQCTAPCLHQVSTTSGCVYNHNRPWLTLQVDLQCSAMCRTMAAVL